MAILLLGPPSDVGEVLITRLIAQGDQVRVASDDDPTLAALFKERGAHVATGEPDDDDFVMRAALNVRTAVVFEEWGIDEDFIVGPTAKGLAAAGVGRVVLVGPCIDSPRLGSFARGGFEYIALSTGRRTGVLRTWKNVVEPHALAEAIDAADDLSGDVRLELDLTDSDAWGELGLARPDHIPR